MNAMKRSMSEAETHEKHFPGVECVGCGEVVFLLEKLLGFTV
jgi:hypothetical protein